MASVSFDIFDEALVSLARTLGALRPTPVAKLEPLLRPLPPLTSEGHAITSLTHADLASLRVDGAAQRATIAAFLVRLSLSLSLARWLARSLVGSLVGSFVRALLG